MKAHLYLFDNIQGAKGIRLKFFISSNPLGTRGRP
jgi:hypothetical protein